ncbi:MAG: hypothetical protein PF569_04265 [Candidatus Woesearchaeota archaeon]|jgi:PBP1b-binding outer membrane lipoprotein LpoB|nr:hypothetical protein [Candidatus Woesearchaeota archaeon]
MKLKNTIMILLTLTLLLFAGCSKTQDVTENNIVTDENTNNQVENANVELNDESLDQLEAELAELDALDEELSLDEDFDLGLN